MFTQLGAAFSCIRTRKLDMIGHNIGRHKTSELFGGTALITLRARFLPQTQLGKEAGSRAFAPVFLRDGRPQPAAEGTPSSALFIEGRVEGAWLIVGSSCALKAREGTHVRGGHEGDERVRREGGGASMGCAGVV